MLPLIYIRENQKALKQGLAKRNFVQPELIDKIIELDQSRRALQAELDEVWRKATSWPKRLDLCLKQERQKKPTS